jgi:hypothetical protein
MAMRKQELYCHNCNRYVQFEVDLELDGNHVLNCPNCDHEHCRVVKAGEITDIRWDQRNGPTMYVSPAYITSSTSSTYATYTAGSASTGTAGTFIYASWMDTTAAS